MKWQTMIAIVGRGQADKVMAAAREAGAPGGTICSARGTASSSLLATLGLGDTRKDVLISVINRGDPDAILSAVQTVKAKGVVMMTDALIEDSEEDGMDVSMMRPVISGSAPVLLMAALSSSCPLISDRAISSCSRTESSFSECA